MYPTLSDYLEKAIIDYKNNKCSSNEDYLKFQRKESKIKKILKKIN